MSMRTWGRKVARANAEKLGVKKMNKKRVINGRIAPSHFAVNWRKFVNTTQFYKPVKKRKETANA